MDPSQAIALHSPRWDAFENGRIEFTGSNVPGFLLKQRSLKAMHDQQQWRDLATSVMDIDLQIDLSYHYLARAALGLGHEAAGLHYLQRAKDMGEVEGKGCAKHLLIGCSGVEVGRK